MSLKDSQGQQLINNNGKYEISIYSGNLTPIVVLQNINRLKTSFPKMSDDFFNILSERLSDNGFSDERMKDAVNYVIDNFQYKELNVSDIIKFDKRVKLYTYNEVCNMVTKGQANFSDFDIREINGNFFRVKKSDLL